MEYQFKIAADSAIFRTIVGTHETKQQYSGGNKITFPKISGSKSVDTRLKNSSLVGTEAPTPVDNKFEIQKGTCRILFSFYSMFCMYTSLRFIIITLSGEDALTVKIPNKFDTTVNERASAELPPTNCIEATR